MTHEHDPTERARLVRELRLMLGRTAWLDGPEMGLASTVSSFLLTRSDAESGTATGLATYVYCVIDSERPLSIGVLGIGPDPTTVRTVQHRDIAAVVSRTVSVLPQPTKAHVLAHHRVTDACMQQHTVVPMAFGTMCRTDEDVVAILRTGYTAFKDVLYRMQGCVEYVLRVQCTNMVREIEAQDAELIRLREQILNSGGLAFGTRREYARLFGELVRRFSEECISHVSDALNQVAVAVRLNEPLDDWMLINGAFLIPRDEAEAFEARVKELASHHGKLAFTSTGPWPPYNFVNLRLTLDRTTLQSAGDTKVLAEVADAVRVEYHDNEELEGHRVVGSPDIDTRPKPRRYTFSKE